MGLRSTRMAWRLARVITRSQKLSKIERQRPREDRRPFIILSDERGRIEVTYYDNERDYVAAFEELDVETGDAEWYAGYNPWRDRH